MTADKLYTSLLANSNMAKLTNHVQRTRLIATSRMTNTIHLTLKMTSLRLSKHRLPTTVLFRTLLDLMQSDKRYMIKFKVSNKHFLSESITTGL